MNIIKRLFGNKDEKGLTDNFQIVSSFPSFFIGNNANIIFSPHLLENCYKGIVSTCIDLKSKYAASAKVVMYKKINQTESVELNKHPFINIMEMPNRFFSGHNLLLNTYQHLEIYGNAYWYVPNGTMGYPTSYENNGGITPLQPRYTKVLYNKGIPIEYEYNTGSTMIKYSLDEIIHIKYNNPFHPFEGMSTIQKAYQQIAIDMDLTNYQSMALKNGGLKKQALKVKQKLTPTQSADLQQQYADAHSGSQGSNKVMILGGDADMVNLGLTTQDLDYIESKKYFKNEIMNILGVHIGMLDAENVNKANVEGAIVIFNHMCVKTMMDAVTSAITLYIKQVYNKDLFMQFILETPEMPEFRLSQYKLGLERNCITVNEYREWCDYDPIEGGDTLLNLNQQVSNNTSDNEKESEENNPDNDTKPNTND